MLIARRWHFQVGVMKRHSELPFTERLVRDEDLYSDDKV